jgi:hypothetical protein
MVEHKPPSPQGTPAGPAPTHAAPHRTAPGPESQRRPEGTQPGPSPESQRPPESKAPAKGPDQHPESTGSQKQLILDHFRSQGAQPDDVIWEFQGLKLRLKDLG